MSVKAELLCKHIHCETRSLKWSHCQQGGWVCVCISASSLFVWMGDKRENKKKVNWFLQSLQSNFTHHTGAEFCRPHCSLLLGCFGVTQILQGPCSDMGQEKESTVCIHRIMESLKLWKTFKTMMVFFLDHVIKNADAALPKSTYKQVTVQRAGGNLV